MITRWNPVRMKMCQLGVAALAVFAAGCGVQFDDGDCASPEVLQQIRDNTAADSSAAIAVLNRGLKPFGCVPEAELVALLDSADTQDPGAESPRIQFVEMTTPASDTPNLPQPEGIVAPAITPTRQ